jgi:hypothetical protein
MAAAAGIAARVGGMRRYYALLLVSGGRAQLVRAHDDITVLADIEFGWQSYRTYQLARELRGGAITASIDAIEVAGIVDESDDSLLGGAVGLVVEEGTMASAKDRVTAV